MALPKRGTRAITVEGHALRWRLGAPQPDGTRRVTVGGERGRLDVVVDERYAVPVTPAVVAGFIRRAMVEGWRPDQPGVTTREEEGWSWRVLMGTVPLPGTEDLDGEHLVAVVDLDVVHGDWPWPHHRGLRWISRVHGGVSAQDAGTLLAWLCERCGLRPEQPPDAARWEEPLELPGGVAGVVDGHVVLWPGCCAVLGAWVGWRDGPDAVWPVFNGHDLGTEIIWHADGRGIVVREERTATPAMVLTEAAYERAVRALEADLRAAVERVVEVAERAGDPELAEAARGALSRELRLG